MLDMAMFAWYLKALKIFSFLSGSETCCHKLFDLPKPLLFQLTSPCKRHNFEPSLTHSVNNFEN
jgi:hypothetical protein